MSLEFKLGDLSLEEKKKHLFFPGSYHFFGEKIRLSYSQNNKEKSIIGYFMGLDGSGNQLLVYNEKPKVCSDSTFQEYLPYDVEDLSYVRLG